MSILIPGQPQSTHNDEPYPVYTRSGWKIPQADKSDMPVISPGTQRIRTDEWKRWRPRIKLRSLSEHLYNCVGMIFASRRVIIEIQHIYDILREDGYRQINLSEAVPGDVVLYKLDNIPSHVASILTINVLGGTPNIIVLSKWGVDAEFEHFIEDVTENLGRPAEYYTERPR